MIFESKELVNVPERGEMPVWSVDTDTQTVTHVHPKTFKTEEHRFYHDYIRYHLHYSEEENPERLQRLVDNGEIFQYLSDLDNRVFDALDSQEELLKANSRDFQEAHEKGDIVTEGAIGNLLQQQARESVFEAMIYV